MDAPHEPQSLIDALIRSMQWDNDKRIREFGAQLLAQWNDESAEEEGIIRYFGDLDDLDSVVSVLEEELAPTRIAEIKDGADLTKQEIARLGDSVSESDFQADGENDAWQITKRQSSNGVEAFVAQTISGCSWEGIQRTFVGVSPSLAAAKHALARLGYLDSDDFRRRYPSRDV